MLPFNYFAIWGWFCKRNRAGGSLMREVKEHMPPVFFWRKLKIEFPIFLFNRICEPLYKHEVIHVKYLAALSKVRTVKIT